MAHTIILKSDDESFECQVEIIAKACEASVADAADYLEQFGSVEVAIRNLRADLFGAAG